MSARYHSEPLWRDPRFRVKNLDSDLTEPYFGLQDRARMDRELVWRCAFYAFVHGRLSLWEIEALP